MSCVFYIIYLPVPDNKGFGTYIICFSCVYGIYIFSRIILFLYKNPRCQYLVSLPPGMLMSVYVMTCCCRRLPLY